MTRELKYQIMNEIENNVDIFKKVSNIRYKIRCPFCGDSQKNLRDAHCYIKCDYENPNEPILYNCFLANCNAKGKVDKNFMNKLGIKSKFIDKISNERYSKISTIKKTNIDVLTGTPSLESPQVNYIEYRLGKGFNIKDYDSFKIIWDMNLIFPYISDQKIKNSLPDNRNSISLLSDDKSTILTRGFEDKDNWRKIKLLSSENKSFYTIKSIFNLFTDDIITVNIAEGVFDVLSIYKNFNDGINSAYIATLGPDYISAVEYAIMKGLVGSNVIIKIYVDKEIDEKKLKFQLKKYRFFFKKIFIYKNIKYKDVGTLISNIELIENQV